jgi:succinate dehydrogenase / fumarate reductase iron-sulfur subunit
MTRMSTFEEGETVTITPLRAFPVIRDLVTDVSFNYQKARETPAFAPPKDVAPGQYRMQQVDVERSQEFRKCIECYLCQNTCHVVRDHEENKPAFSGPRFFIRAAELDMHPLDARSDRKQYAQANQGLGMCNITKCCTEVCPEHIKITDNAIIPMKERVVDRRYDPLVWLGRKIFRRDELERDQQPVFGPATASTGGGSDADDIEVQTPGTPFTSARLGEGPSVNDDGHLDVSELAATHQGGPSPFGDDQEFPLPAGGITYVQPTKPEEVPDNDKPH